MIKNVSIAFNEVVFLNKKLEHFTYIDSLYTNFSKAAKRKFELGESNYLEMITSQSKYKQYEMQLNQLKQDKTIALEKFNFLLQSEEEFTISELDLLKIKVERLMTI